MVKNRLYVSLSLFRFIPPSLDLLLFFKVFLMQFLEHVA